MLEGFQETNSRAYLPQIPVFTETCLKGEGHHMNDFYAISTLALEEIAEFFESSWPLADVDLLEDTLTITLPHNRQYVIHRHGVTHQIWIASPFTGAHHFHWKEGQWWCTRTNLLLKDLLMTERDAHAT